MRIIPAFQERPQFGACNAILSRSGSVLRSVFRVVGRDGFFNPLQPFVAWNFDFSHIHAGDLSSDQEHRFLRISHKGTRAGQNAPKDSVLCLEPAGGRRKQIPALGLFNDLERLSILRNFQRDFFHRVFIVRRIIVLRNPVRVRKVIPSLRRTNEETTAMPILPSRIPGRPEIFFATALVQTDIPNITELR
jgi:hypothetical protein